MNKPRHIPRKLVIIAVSTNILSLALFWQISSAEPRECTREAFVRGVPACNDFLLCEEWWRCKMMFNLPDLYFNPRSDLVYIGVNAIFVRLSTFLAPTYNSSQHPNTWLALDRASQRSSCIEMTCVSAALFKTCTHESIIYRAVVRSRKNRKVKVGIKKLV